MILSSKGGALSRRLGRLAGVVVPGVAAFAIGCGDAPSAPTHAVAPTQAPSYSSTAGWTTPLTPAQALMRTTPLAATVVVTKTLSNSGGGIAVPGTDFQLQVPTGAFTEQSLTFTITAYAGGAVAYDFQPHGHVFLKPLKAVQQLGHTNWKSFNLPAGYYGDWSGGYFADPRQINMQTGSALINEFMAGGVNVGGATMTWDIPHFSGYMVSVGRSH